MNRRGAVLLIVLWLMVLIGGGAIAVLGELREGSWKSRNRVDLMRTGWALEGCLELILSRAYGPASPRADSIALGDGLWCRYRIDDPQARLNLNLAPLPLLSRVLSDSLAAAVMDWRDPDSEPRPLGAESEWYRQTRGTRPRNAPLRSPRELELIRGGNLAASRGQLTVWGSGRVNLNVASRDVLLALPGVDTASVETLLARRRAGLAAASLQARSPEAQLELDRLVSSAPDVLVAFLSGGTGRNSTSHEAVILIPAQERLAIIRRLWTVLPCETVC